MTPTLRILPAVASDAAGNFVVVWQSHGQEGDPAQNGIGVFGQRYFSSGAPVGPEFRVNTYTTDAQRNPSATSDAAGNFFLVVWQSLGQEGQAGSNGIYGQVFSSTGAPAGAEFLVNTTVTSGDQRFPKVSSDASGNAVVVWESQFQEPVRGIYGQRYSALGASLGTEFHVNTYTTDDQRYPAVSASNGSFVVVWSSKYQVSANSSYDVFGQRYGAILPVELLRFKAE